MSDPGRVLVGSVTVAHKQDGNELSWLLHAEAMRASHPAGADFFCAIEIDARGLEPFKRLLDRLDELDADIWTYGIDKAPRSSQPYQITTNDRFIRIATGRNLIGEKVVTGPYTHALFLDTDTEPTPDTLPRLLEIEHPIVGGMVPTYCLPGEPVDLPWLPGADVRRHLFNTAGYLLVHRDVLRHVRWGWDVQDEMSDDPTFARDVKIAGFGDTLVRHDVIGRHHPPSIGPLEHRGADLHLYR